MADVRCVGDASLVVGLQPSAAPELVLCWEACCLDHSFLSGLAVMCGHVTGANIALGTVGIVRSMCAEECEDCAQANVLLY